MLTLKRALPPLLACLLLAHAHAQTGYPLPTAPPTVEVSPFPGTLPPSPPPVITQPVPFRTEAVSPSPENPSSSITPSSPPPLGTPMDTPQTQSADVSSTTPPPETAEVSPRQLPTGTLGPVMLKARLEKKQELPLSLEQALKLAVGQNIKIGIAEENVQIQKLEYYYRLSELLPDIVGEYKQSKLKGAIQIIETTPLEIDITTYQPQIRANYSVYTGGRNIFEIIAARQRAHAQKNLSEETRQDILRQVALAYYDLQGAYWQRGIALQAIKEAEQEVALQQARLDAGEGIRLDVLQAQTFLASRQQELLLAERGISVAAERLSQLLDMDTGVDILPVSIDSTIRDLVSDEMPISTLVQIAKLHNPRLKAQEKLAQAAQTDVKVAISDLFPRIDISAYLNKTAPEFGMINDVKTTRFGGIQASWNIMDNMGFAKPIRFSQVKSNAHIADLNRKNTERALEETIANTLTDLETLKSRIRLARESLNFSSQAYEHAVGRMQEGIGTYIDVENTMTELTRSRINLANAFITYNRVQSELLSLLGVASVETLIQGYHPNGNQVGKKILP